MAASAAAPEVTLRANHFICKPRRSNIVHKIEQYIQKKCNKILVPNYGKNAGEERRLVGPELIAYLQWLIYSAPFKSQDQGARRDEHMKYYYTWVVSFKARWGAYRKKLLKELEKWFHKHPPGMTKGRRKSKVPSQTSMALHVDEGLLLESGSDREGGGPSGAAAPAAAAAPAPAGGAQ